jgi:hypothetical protein
VSRPEAAAMLGVTTNALNVARHRAKNTKKKGARDGKGKSNS